MYKIIGADGKEYGPVPPEVVRRWVAEGRANDDSKILPEGKTEWKTLRELPEFQSASTSTVPGPIGPIQATQPTAGLTQTNSLAVFGFVLGILSLPFSLCCYGLPFNLAGIIVSAIALTQIREQKQQGRGLALAGLVLSIASIALSALLLVLALASGVMNPWHRIHRL